jgi:hypothetical protein
VMLSELLRYAATRGDSMDLPAETLQVWALVGRSGPNQGCWKRCFVVPAGALPLPVSNAPL